MSARAPRGRRERRERRERRAERLAVILSATKGQQRDAFERSYAGLWWVRGSVRCEVVGCKTPRECGKCPSALGGVSEIDFGSVACSIRNEERVRGCVCEETTFRHAATRTHPAREVRVRWELPTRIIKDESNRPPVLWDGASARVNKKGVATSARPPG
eukprot:1194011-Prorocentrum_minimum.AAC.2